MRIGKGAVPTLRIVALLLQGLSGVLGGFALVAIGGTTVASLL
jgi:hypothetical protein